MAETASFALRMPPEIKEAAKALTKVTFCEPSDKGEGYINHIWLSSINEALVYLMKKGLSETLNHIETELKEYTERMAVSQEIMTFFLANPVASEVRPANLPEGSRAREHLEKLQAEHEEDEPSDYEDAGKRYDVVTRREATDEYASEQRKVYALTEAKGFIQKALIAKRH